MASPDLADLDAFVAVARARGFRSAALLRGVSASSLSASVRRLEERLDVRLLNRTTRSVTLTEAGERLVERLGPALGDVAQALDAINGGGVGPRGTLKLNVPTIVADTILPPLAARFLIQHPGVTLDITNNDIFIDVLAAGFDAGVRYDERVERDMIAVPLGPRRQEFVVAAAPSYLAAHGAPNEPRDLLNHACIRHRFASGVIWPWTFEREGKTVRITPDGPLVATNIEMEMAAAVAGLGVICTFEDYLREPLRKGALVPVLENWRQEFSGPFLYYPSRRQMPAPLRAFVDFLKHS